MEITIVELNPTAVASCQYIGKDPEEHAFEALLDWARRSKLLTPGQSSRMFGFNNPNPVGPGSTYGYEVWLPLEAKAEEGGGVRIKNMPGGKYAAVVAPAPSGEGIMQGWQAFRLNMIPDGYTYDRSRACLEEHVVDAAKYPNFEDDPEFKVRLMTPVQAK